MHERTQIDVIYIAAHGKSAFVAPQSKYSTKLRIDAIDMHFASSKFLFGRNLIYVSSHGFDWMWHPLLDQKHYDRNWVFPAEKASFQFGMPFKLLLS